MARARAEGERAGRPGRNGWDEARTAIGASPRNGRASGACTLMVAGTGLFVVSICAYNLVVRYG